MRVYQESSVPVGNYSSFILRLWVEPNGGWRWGLIQHVATRKKRRFSTVSEMLDFISQYSADGEVSIPFLLNGTELQADAEAEAEAREVELELKVEAAKDGGSDSSDSHSRRGNRSAKRPRRDD